MEDSECKQTQATKIMYDNSWAISISKVPVFQITLNKSRSNFILLEKFNN